MKANPANDPHPRMLSTSSLTGSEVRTPEDERLGEIIELMIDLETGQVAYAVLAVDAFLGLVEKYFALPWTALAVDPTRRCFLLDIEKDWLKHLPGFDPKHWPETADRRFLHDLYRHNGYVLHDVAHEATV